MSERGSYQQEIHTTDSSEIHREAIISVQEKTAMTEEQLQTSAYYDSTSLKMARSKENYIGSLQKRKMRIEEQQQTGEIDSMSLKIARNEEHSTGSQQERKAIEFSYHKSPAFKSSMTKKFARTEEGQPSSSRLDQQMKTTATSITDYRRRLLDHVLSSDNMAGSHNQPIYHDSPTTFSRNAENQKYLIESRRLQLRFLNIISQPVFTGHSIKGEDGHFLTLVLIDSHSGEVVTYGPEASARVELVVLEADFDTDSCTRENFKMKIIKKGDNPLLTGNLILHLKDGIRCVGSVGFSHTSVWKGICKYRLGAIVADDDVGTRIREGFTDSFVVKDRRLTLLEKKYPPTQSDELWRIKGISRKGAFCRRLNDELKIHTVGDLWKSLNSDPKKLRDVLGKAMSDRKWEDLEAHVQTCKIDERPCKIIGPIQEVHCGIQIPISLETDSPKLSGPSLEIIPTSGFVSRPVDHAASYWHKRPYDVPLATQNLQNRGKRTLNASYQDLQALSSVALTHSEEFVMPALNSSYHDQQAHGFVALNDCGGFLIPALSPSYQDLQALGSIAPTDGGDLMIPALSASNQDLHALGSVALTNAGDITSYEMQDFQIGAQDFAIPASYITMDSWSNGGYTRNLDISPNYLYKSPSFSFQFHEDEHKQLFDPFRSTSPSQL